MSSRALVVDDVATNRRMLSRILEGQGLSVVESSNYPEAVQALSHAQFDVVLLDLALGAQGSGQELLAFLSTRAPDESPVVIVVTGSLRDARSEAALLGAGAHDFVTRPFNIDVLGARVSNALRERARRQSLSAQVRHAEVCASRDRESLISAATLQALALPRFPVRDSRVAATGAVVPSHLLSGDVIDVVADASGRTSVFVLDVAGHGAPAAYVSSAARTTLRAALFEGGDLRTVCQRVSSELGSHGSEVHGAATLSLVRFAGDGLCAEVINAGMPAIAKVAADGALTLFRSSAAPLGLGMPLPRVDVTVASYSDAFILGSDGLLPGMEDSDVEKFVRQLCGSVSPNELPGLSPTIVRLLIQECLSSDSAPDDDATLVFASPSMRAVQC